MNYVFFTVMMLISIYSYTFARFMGDNGNRTGMFGVFVLIIINFSLTLYRMINAG